jgi:hypothetical protein
MGVFGDVAVEAAVMTKNKKGADPRAAWERCMAGKDVSPSTKAKPCPKSTFLGLCEKGLINGIPAGHYTKSVKNKSYGIEAVKALREDPALARNKKELWRHIGNDGIRHNSQMDVVISLWNRGLLNTNKIDELRGTKTS